jgi:hypothetical protein
MTTSRTTCRTVESEDAFIHTSLASLHGLSDGQDKQDANPADDGTPQEPADEGGPPELVHSSTP